MESNGRIGLALLWPGKLGVALLILGIIGAVVTIVGYAIHLRRPQSQGALWTGRFGYLLSAMGAFGTFAVLAGIVFYRKYEYQYAFFHTGNYLQGWYRLAATWSAQEGSFLLWAGWTALIGFLVMAKAGKYEARVMPFFVTILAFLCAILLKQSPFHLVPLPDAEMLAANPMARYPLADGRGLTPSLVNYWMTIHPPTIFFGFASLAVPYCYSIAALLWKDYEGWTPRVMPYSLLSCATLGIGLFMGGYWAYETQGWHGFWAWDPVENASFFPWLAITALVHGAVVQRSRGGMARANTFLGILAFWLFLLGTFLTRSGALSGEGADGQMLSVHAFDNIGKSSLILMVGMLAVYGLLGLGLWLFRLPSMPTRRAVGETLVSRDFAFFMAVTLMLVACFIITLGTTLPLMQGWLHRPLSAPKPSFYNKGMLPVTLLVAFALGCVPWLAWRRTDPDTFLRRLLVPWLLMLAFGFGMFFWVLSAERGLSASIDPSSTEAAETLRAWVNPRVQRMAVIALTSLGFLAALSNAMLAFRVFRAKPLAAGGWLAHVGIGVMIVGVVISNTYERTERITLVQGEGPQKVFGYQFAFEKMTGKPPDARPLNPDFDRNNAVMVRVTPPGVDDGSDKSSDMSGGPKTFLAELDWFVHNLHTAEKETDLQRMRWPSIHKYLGHDLYLGLATDAGYKVPVITLREQEKKQVGPYILGYFKGTAQPGKYFGAHLVLKTEDGKIIEAQPGFVMQPGEKPGEFTQVDMDMAIPELRDEQGVPGAIYLRKMDAATKAVTLLVNLPGNTGNWEVPLEITFKPWVNLVWTGVILTGVGTLLAMVRRALEARKVTDAVPALQEPEPWARPEQPGATAPSAVPVPAMTADAAPPQSPPVTRGKSRKRPVST